ncbi:winged helix-turn-helix transcriptional regulator [Leptolyngbya sp. 7M]|uniref:winged helix-turn-helix transcriptional regulator n=1 Tax=Leptolyngbya sp. 7M TaxID=2812896 RepID=UPI001B8B4DB2|nr:helix-turn-helix domain-containing protein [Leptolyngbya sp. 7M]QYO66741.1 helix-turn-helix transcriptional regulator [Leptolyngbya sp. 7M]
MTERPQVHRMVENIIRCKWSLSVLDLVKNGVNRPGAMERAVDGLTTKVLNERLRKLVRFGILEKTTFPEVPLRVEYEFTDFGQRFIRLLEAIDELEEEISNTMDQAS